MDLALIISKLIFGDLETSAGLQWTILCNRRVGKVWVIYVGGPRNPKLVIEPRLAVEIYDYMLSRYGTHFYLVEVSGTLLFVAQCAETVEPNGHDYVYETYKFRVWELDVIKGEAKEIEILGDGAIFLGCNASISIDSSKFAGVKPNRVYFTDTWRELFSHLGGGGRDC